MRDFLPLAATLFAASVLPAQAFFSPPGAEHVEGNGGSVVLFGSNAGWQCRNQQADENFVGHPLFLLMRSIAWRRDATSASGATPRVAEITLIMSHSDYNSFSTTFASNYKDTPVTVFTKKNINLPDWTTTPPRQPAPFDCVVPFDIPWVYNRTDALLWEIVVTNTGAGGGYGMDWYSVAVTDDWSQTHFDQGPGCTTRNGVFNKIDVHRSDVSNLHVGFEISGGPSNAPVIVLVGRFLQSTTVPGLCAPLGTDILLTLVPGVTDGAGRLLPAYVTIPWQSAFSWLTLSSQVVAPDTTQPGISAVVSNATLAGLPKTAGTPGLNFKRAWNVTSATAPMATTTGVGGVPARYAN